MLKHNIDKLYLIEFRHKLYGKEVCRFTFSPFKKYKKAVRCARLYNNIFKKNKNIIKSSAFKVKKYREINSNKYEK